MGSGLSVQGVAAHLFVLGQGHPGGNQVPHHCGMGDDGGKRGQVTAGSAPHHGRFVAAHDDKERSQFILHGRRGLARDAQTTTWDADGGKEQAKGQTHK